jgi:hypothetical protein
MKTKARTDVDSDLPIPRGVRQLVSDQLRASGRGYPKTHPYAGVNTERAGRGDPGHCEACAVVGHLIAHPAYGCGDVHCNVDH